MAVQNEWLKGQKSVRPLVRTLNDCVIRLIFRKFCDFDCNSYRKMTMSRFFHKNPLGIKFDHAVK